MGASTYSHLTGPNAIKPDEINGCIKTEETPPNSPLLCVAKRPSRSPSAAQTFAAARSKHNGGVVAGRAVGSVGFYADDIQIDVWQALATRARSDRTDGEEF